VSKPKPQPKTKKCPIPDCWEQIPEHHALCPACRSWWQRMQMKDERELASYMQRLGRFTGRTRSKLFTGWRRSAA